MNLQKRLLCGILCLMMLLSMVACTGQGSGNAGTSEPAPSVTTEEPKPTTPTAAEFSIVYADDASNDIKDAAGSIRYRIKTAYDADIAINPETPTKHVIALGACRDEGKAIQEELGVNTYVVKSINLPDGGVSLTVVGNNERSTGEAINAFKTMIGEKTWEELIKVDVTDTLGLKYPNLVSFYGDSITTYEGVSNAGLYNSTLVGQRVWYNTTHMKKSETWWSVALSQMDANLCVNNAYSGDDAASEFAVSRAENLHKDFMNKIVEPDTIIVYFGINDCGKQHEATFRNDYKAIITKMKERYPNATIFCCTLLAGHTYKGARLAPFNADIRAVAKEMEVNLIDLDATIGADFERDMADLMIDKDLLHPNKDGMKRMGDAVAEAIREWYYGE